MRFLIVGAGALGSYFGARLLAAGRDVTFLLRPRRAAQLAQTGLVVRSPRGDLQLPAPPHVLAGQITVPFDVVLLSCRAHDLESTMDAVAPAVGPASPRLAHVYLVGRRARRNQRLHPLPEHIGYDPRLDTFHQISIQRRANCGSDR